MRRHFLTVFIIIVASATSNGQKVTSLSLNDCIEYALKHNYNIKNAAVDVLIQQAQVNEQVSAAYPHLNGKAELDYFYAPQQSFIDASTFGALDPTGPAIPKGTIEAFQFTLPYSPSVGVTATQVLFDGGVTVALKARRTVMEFARLNGDVTEESVRYNVIKAYHSLAIAYRQYDIIKSSLAYARSLEHDIEVTKQNGFAEKIDVERTDVQVNNLATDSIRISNMLTVSEQLLKYQIGMDVNTPIALTDTVVERRRQEAAALLSETENYDRIPEYQLAQSGLRLNQYNLERYQMAAYPSVNVFGMYGANYGAEVFSNVWEFQKYWTYTTIGLQVNIPIFNGMMRKNQVTEARLNIEKSKNNIDFLKQSIDFQATTARTNLSNAILETQSQHRNLDLANDVLDLARRKYKAGVGSNLEVTQAQTDQLRAQTNYFSALLDIINAEVDLKKALGLLK